MIEIISRYIKKKLVKIKWIDNKLKLENVIYYLFFYDIGYFLLLFKEIYDIGKLVDRVFFD